MKAIAAWTRRHYVVVLATVVFVAAGSAFVAVSQAQRSHTGSTSAKPGTSTITNSSVAPTVQPAAAEFVAGPTGLTSSEIIAENARPGTTDWKIAATPATGYVHGWANQTSAQLGDNVGIYVSSTAAQFRVIAYRMGFYADAGAREVWRSPMIDGHVQEKCPVISPVTINKVSCSNWTRSLTMTVTSSFVQGEYLLKFVGVNGEQSYAPLTIWDPANTATYLFEHSIMTSAAWNDYGGYSFYKGTGPCPAGAPSYPVCNRARIASFDRPYLDAFGAGDFLYNELPLLRFMESKGLDVSYVTDVDLDVHPEVMLNHRAFLSLGHDETWTYNERKGAEAALAKGVNFAFMSAAAMVRHARLQPSAIGPNREVVEYRDSAEDPEKDPRYNTGNTWAVPPTSWSPNAFLGQQYSGYLHEGVPNAAFVVWDSSAWIFEGTGLHNGSSIPDVIGSDIDHLDTATTPANLQVLGHSPISLDVALTNQGKWNGLTYSDMTYYTNPASHGGVFDSGAVSWINALSRCSSPTSCPAPIVQQMTGNLLALFGKGPAGDFQPPVSNWRGVTPLGS